MPAEIINCRIKTTKLGYQDHGILTAFVYVEWMSNVCGFGGYALDQYSAATGDRHGTAFGADFIAEVLQALGVDAWEKLPGLYCRIKLNASKITAIGHICEDRWFDPELLVLKHKG